MVSISRSILTLTYTQTPHRHSIRHGTIYVPFEEYSEMVKGRWLHMDPVECKREHVEAFAALERTMSGVHNNKARWSEMLASITAEEAVAAKQKQS